jgi:hypothetical protein
MLKDDSAALLKVGSAVSRHGYDQAILLATQKDDILEKRAQSFCHGRRQFGRPMMALTAKRSLGPVRHVLSQMVVSGTMTVNPPVQVRISSPQEGAVESGE